MGKKIFILFIAILVTALAVAPAAARGESRLFDRFLKSSDDEGSDAVVDVTDTIVDLAIATPELSTLVQAVLQAEADIVTTLSEDGRFTVFAPTNAAFEAAGIDPAAFVTDEQKSALAGVLLDHVASGDFSSRFLASQSRSGERLSTLGGLSLGVSRSPLAVNGAAIVLEDIPAENGRVHVIDAVLLRPAPSIAGLAGGTDSLSTLFDAVVEAGLADTLTNGGPFTVFAPVNSAFDKIGVDPAIIDDDALRAVLLDHVVPGEFTTAELAALRISGGSLRTLGGLDLEFRIFPFRVNGKRILAANVSGANGIVHVIDAVLLDPEN